MPLRPTPSKPKAPPVPVAGQAAAPAGPDLDYHLQTFWEKYSTVVLGVCAVVMLAIVAKGGWEYFEAQQEAGIEKEFAADSTPALQKTFIAAHPDHALAGVAELQIADAAYAANQISDALAAYTQAVAVLKTGPFAARASLGLAMSKLESGQADEGETGLRELADDPQGYKPVRTEAAYHLASLAAAAGRSADLQKLSTQLLQIDPDSPWTERVFALQAQQAAAAPGSPAISVPGGVSFKP
jgi:hypothetical protein